LNLLSLPHPERGFDNSGKNKEQMGRPKCEKSGQ